ncbi:universal stress protein [Actinomadura luzonensis]|uniref:universal stress protein n=1 Tax=Actinomadura luzonensis TaxID=2805427 RepID=UPI0026744B39|nr:universal stress protein [Actinomadura luzonensis]
MTGRLVVAGVDGTPAAEPALLWAAAEAGPGGRLLIVHAWEPIVAYHALYARQCAPGDLLERRLSALRVLDRAAGLVRKTCPGVAVECRLVPGRAETALPAAAEGADLLVLGSLAQRRGDGRLGAVLLSCLRWPPGCPVVVVPGMPAGGGRAVSVPAEAVAGPLGGPSL